MLDFLRENGFILGALTGGLAGAVFKTIFDHLQREKKNLLFIVNSRMVLGRNRLKEEIRYKDEPVESLCSHEVIVHNRGNRGLKEIPIKIMCESGRFVGVPEIIKGPKGAKYQSITEDDNKTAVVKYDLLKKGEEFEISLIAVDSVDSQIMVVARVDEVNEKQITREEEVLILKRWANVLRALVFIFLGVMMGIMTSIVGLVGAIVVGLLSVGVLFYGIQKNHKK